MINHYSPNATTLRLKSSRTNIGMGLISRCTTQEPHSLLRQRNRVSLQWIVRKFFAVKLGIMSKYFYLQSQLVKYTTKNPTQLPTTPRAQ